MSRWISNLSLAFKCYCVLAAALFGVVLLGGLSVHSLGKVVAGIETVYKDRIVPMDSLKKISDMYAVNIVDTCHKVRNGNLTFEAGLKNLKDAQAVIAKEWQAYNSTVLTKEEEALVEGLNGIKAKGDALCSSLETALATKNMDRLAVIATSELYPVIDPITEKVSDLMNLQLRVAGEEYKSSKPVYAGLVQMTIFISLAAAALSILISRLVTRSITLPVQQISDA